MPPPDPVTMATLPEKSNRTMGDGPVSVPPVGVLTIPSRCRRSAMTLSATALTSVDSGHPM